MMLRAFPHQAHGPARIRVAAEQPVRATKYFDVVEFAEVRRTTQRKQDHAIRLHRRATIDVIGADGVPARVERLVERAAAKHRDAGRVFEHVRELDVVLQARLLAADDGDGLGNLAQRRRDACRDQLFGHAHDHHFVHHIRLGRVTQGSSRDCLALGNMHARRPHLDGLIVDHAERQAGARKQCTQRGLDRVGAGQRRRRQPFGDTREEDDLEATLPRELLQRQVQWLAIDAQLVD
jgi:hypothetical protein